METYRDTQVRAFEERLGFTFKNQDLLTEALTHRSYAIDNPDHPFRSNELLEFYGDTILQFVVTQELFGRFHNDSTADEGRLSIWRAALVNNEQLGKIGKRLNINEVLLVSNRDEVLPHIKAKHWRSLTARAFEAVIGALHLDQGIDPVRHVVNRYLLNDLEHIVASFVDWKSKLQGMVQKKTGSNPTYRVLQTTTVRGVERFKVGVFLHNELMAYGTGLSKKEAEIMAAQEAAQSPRFK